MINVINVVKAYILFNVEIQNIDDVLEALSQVPEILEFYTLYGNYDLIAIVEVESSKLLKKLTTGIVRKIPAILNTMTMVVV